MLLRDLFFIVVFHTEAKRNRFWMYSSVRFKLVQTTLVAAWILKFTFSTGCIELRPFIRINTKRLILCFWITRSLWVKFLNHLTGPEVNKYQILVLKSADDEFVMSFRISPYAQNIQSSHKFWFFRFFFSKIRDFFSESDLGRNFSSRVSNFALGSFMKLSFQPLKKLDFGHFHLPRITTVWKLPRQSFFLNWSNGTLI